MSKALIIIDIQNDYFEGGAFPLVNAEQASENARLILDKFRENNLPVVHIQHVSTRSGATFFLPDTDGANIHKSVLPKENEKVIIKHFPNSFRETELLEYLQSKNIMDLIIIGMMTQNCVDSTVRAAKDFGFNCTVVGDACATKDLEINGEQVKAAEVQKAFLSALSYFYATVVSTQKYLS